MILYVALRLHLEGSNHPWFREFHKCRLVATLIGWAMCMRWCKFLKRMEYLILSTPSKIHWSPNGIYPNLDKVGLLLTTLVLCPIYDLSSLRESERAFEEDNQAIKQGKTKLDGVWLTFSFICSFIMIISHFVDSPLLLPIASQWLIFP